MAGEFIASINKKYGKGTIQTFNDAPEIVDFIPTGSLGLDVALGIGGMPRGRVIEIYGPEMSGKTTLCLSLIAQAQKRGAKALYVDAEFALDKVYAAKLGVDVEAMDYHQPDYGEMALDVVDQACAAGEYGIIVIDSVAGLVPKAELEGDMGDSHMGLQARLMGQALRKIVGNASKTNTLVAFTNQTRLKIGVMFGNPETTPGGLALKFWSSVRLRVTQTEMIKEGEVKTGKMTKVVVQKNKLAPPFREAEFEIIFGEGINSTGEILDIGIKYGVLSKAGAWFVYGENKIANGRANTITWLKDNASEADSIKAKIMEAVKTVAPKKAVVDEVE